MEPEFGLAYLGVGYALAFLALIAYVVHLARRQKEVEKKLDEMQKSEPGSRA